MKSSICGSQNNDMYQKYVVRSIDDAVMEVSIEKSCDNNKVMMDLVLTEASHHYEISLNNQSPPQRPGS